jgi:NAD(P)-dependent dehydrogenase (short-subunit alcohol dehydrogenase family)
MTFPVIDLPSLPPNTIVPESDSLFIPYLNRLYEDIANAVTFLASPESGWITAQMLTVDGGRMDYIGHA